MVLMRREHLAAAFAVSLLATGCNELIAIDRFMVRDAGGAHPDGGGMDGGGNILEDAGWWDAGSDDAGANTRDAGESGCGQLGQPCCALPSPACVEGANCTLEGCSPCGRPGEACCDNGVACQRLSCLETGQCPHVSRLVQIPKPSGDAYGIDAHEVTRKQYSEWIQTNPVATGLLVGRGCADNTSFLPDVDCLASGYGCSGAGCSERPQICIDWCDAYAYCVAVGKQLCGGYGGEPLSVGSFFEPSLSPWYNACSSGGMFRFGTGDTVDSAVCHFTDRGQAADAASLVDCQSPLEEYRGVLALTGNVREWINSCDPVNDPSASCLAMGGAYLDNDHYEGQCDISFTVPRDGANASTGFRCCELAP